MNKFDGMMKLIKIDMDRYNQYIIDKLKKIEYDIKEYSYIIDGLRTEREILNQLHIEIFNKYIDKERDN